MYNLIDTRHKFPFTFKDGKVWKPKGKCPVYNSILDSIGNTPLVKLNKIPKEYNLECEIYAKCEFLNPGGSIKDRTVLAMVRDAEEGGNVTRDTVFVESTSGNTGISVAFDAALRDKKCIIVTAEKNSSEKVTTMQLLGAEVIQTKKSSTEIARQIYDDDPKHVIILNQFENPANPRIHYETTAEEIINTLGEVDMVVLGAGTGGTLTGVGHKMKERYPNCQMIVAEPDGSTMFNVDGDRRSFLVEGIGGSSIPIVLDKSVADGFEVVTDEDSFLMARNLCQKEGSPLCSGSAMVAAIKAAKRMNLGRGNRVVVVLVDGIRNYMTKFVCNQWMEAHLFMDPPKHIMRWWKDPITEIVPSREYPMIDSRVTCLEAMKVMGEINIAVVVNDKGWFVGNVSKDGFRNFATNPTKLPGQDSEQFDFNEPVTKHMLRNNYILAKNGKKGMPTIGLLSRILDITDFVVIGENIFEDNEARFIPESVATADEVFNYILNHS